MKTKKFLLAVAVGFCGVFATNAFAQLPDPGDIPLYPIENEHEITKMLEKAEELVSTLKKAEIVMDELLKKYGKKVIEVNGQKVITTQKPVPIPELELLKPMLPILKPEYANGLIAELKSLEINLINYLNKREINMGPQLQKELTPQKATSTLKRVQDFNGYVSSKDPNHYYNCFEAMGGDNIR